MSEAVDGFGAVVFWGVGGELFWGVDGKVFPVVVIVMVVMVVVVVSGRGPKSNFSKRSFSQFYSKKSLNLCCLSLPGARGKWP